MPNSGLDLWKVITWKTKNRNDESVDSGSRNRKVQKSYSSLLVLLNTWSFNICMHSFDIEKWIHKSEALWQHKLRIFRIIISSLPFCWSVAQFFKPYGFPNILAFSVCEIIFENKPDSSRSYMSNNHYVKNEVVTASHRIPCHSLKRKLYEHGGLRTFDIYFSWHSSPLSGSFTYFEWIPNL